MEEKKPLFDKPMDELREAFVRNRFAQVDVFGMADVEAWIKEQYTNEVPPNADTDAWRTLLKHDELVDFIRGGAILLLQKYATTLHDLGLPRHEPTGYSHLLPLVGRGLYWGKDNRGIYLHPDPVNTQAVYLVHGKAPEDHEHSLTFDCAGRNNLKDIHETVLEIMFAEWWRGDPKRDAARQYLCEAADVAIRRERAKAEHDFDTAVAVSADGTKIVHADWVVVFDPAQHTWHVRATEYFREHKILRHDFMNRSSDIAGGRDIVENPALSTESAKQLYVNLRQSVRYLEAPLQVFVDCRTEPAKLYSVLISSPDLCPSPLPDGGVEVAV